MTSGHLNRCIGKTVYRWLYWVRYFSSLILAHYWHLMNHREYRVLSRNSVASGNLIGWIVRLGHRWSFQGHFSTQKMTLKTSAWRQITTLARVCQCRASGRINKWFTCRILFSRWTSSSEVSTMQNTAVITWWNSMQISSGSSQKYILDY